MKPDANKNLENSIEAISLEAIASPNKRFINSVIDLLAISLLAYITCPYEAGLYLFYFVLYYLTFESVLGITIGKLITRTKVSDCFGNKPSFFAIFIRTIARLIPFEAFSFLSKNGSGWHDFFSQTYVINHSKKQIELKQESRN